MALLRGTINRALHAQYGYIVEGKAKPVDDRLIWRMDMHLLAGALDEKGWRDLADRALASGLAPLVWQELRRAQATFGTVIPSPVSSILARAKGDGPLQQYLALKDALARAQMDLRACAGWREAAELVSCHLFPGPQHMRQRFPEKQAWPLPALYALRIVRGGWKMLAGGRRARVVRPWHES